MRLTFEGKHRSAVLQICPYLVGCRPRTVQITIQASSRSVALVHLPTDSTQSSLIFNARIGA